MHCRIVKTHLHEVKLEFLLDEYLWILSKCAFGIVRLLADTPVGEVHRLGGAQPSLPLNLLRVSSSAYHDLSPYASDHMVFH